MRFPVLGLPLPPDYTDIFHLSFLTCSSLSPPPSSVGSPSLPPPLSDLQPPYSCKSDVLPDLGADCELFQTPLLHVYQNVPRIPRMFSILDSLCREPRQAARSHLLKIISFASYRWAAVTAGKIQTWSLSSAKTSEYFGTTKYCKILSFFFYQPGFKT